MDPRVYGGPRAQGQDQGRGARGRQDESYTQRGKQEDLFAQREKQDELFAQREKQDDLFAQKGKQEDLFAQRGKQEDLFAQREKQEEALAQRGKQEDLFAQRSKQDDLFKQKGRQEDTFGKITRKVDASLRLQEEPQRRPKESFGGSKGPLSGEPQKAGGGRDTYGEFSYAEEAEHSVPQPVDYASVSGETELHGAPGHELMHNPAMQTMVKMVSMLNFMKVELGETKTLKSKEQWRAAGAEFIGTLLFVYLGCGSVVASGMLDSEMTPSRLMAIAIAHGLAISFLAGATGAISGGHLNPAVTLAFVVAGKENLVRAGLYVAAQVLSAVGCCMVIPQLLGAIFGAILLNASTPEYLRGTLGSHDISENIFSSQAFLMETILTFVLVFVIFGVAVDRRGPGVIAPLPIGFAVLVDHLVGVPYTGASMNPARSFGPALVSGYFGSAHLVYWVAPCFGASAASALYRFAFLEPAEAAALVAASLRPK